MTNLIPLLVLLAILAGGSAIIYHVLKSVTAEKSQAEKEAINKGVIATILSDSLLIGALVAKHNKDFDLKDKKLK